MNPISCVSSNGAFWGKFANINLEISVCVFTNFDVKHSPSLPVGEETKDEAQEDNGMSAPLDCQEAKETKEKSTNNLSSCYQDGAYGS